MSFSCSNLAQTFLQGNITQSNQCFKPTGKIENLLNWSTFLSPKVEIYEGQFGLGVFANDQIYPEENLLSIEKENLITIDKAFLVRNLIAYNL